MKQWMVAMLAIWMAGLALAAEDPPLLPRSEPYVPKAQRIPSSEPAAAGVELQAQALRKLRQRFNEADSDRNGLLSRQEAARSGLGYVERHFDQIDRNGRGEVSFDDVQAWLKRAR